MSQDIEKVAIYCRVSSEQQREQGTIKSQRATLEGYAKRQGYSIYRVYEDDGFSGATIEGRPAFKRLLVDAQNQLFDAILVVEQNRITRTDNDEEEGRILMILKVNNIRLVSPHEGILDLNNPLFRLMAKFKFWASAEERAEITRKMKRGKRQRLLEGKWVSGTTPYGYLYEKETGTWSFHREQSRLYLELVRKFLREGWSLNRICADLQERGIKGKQGKDWAPSTLTYMFRNPAYKGDLYANQYEYQYDPVRGKSRRVGKKPQREWIKLSVPPLISAEEWDLIQQQLDANRKKGRPSKSPTNLLKGFLVCGICGAKLLRTNGARPQDTYYVCHNRRSPKHKRSNQTRKRCPLPYLPSEKLDDLMLSYFSRFIGEPDFVIDELISSEHSEERRGEVSNQKEALEREIQGDKQKLGRLLDLYLDGNFAKRVLDDKADRLGEQIRQKTAALQSLSRELSSFKRAQLNRSRLKREVRRLAETFGEHIQDHLQKADFEDKRAFLEAFFESSHDRILVAPVPGARSSHLPDGVGIAWETMFNVELMKKAAKQARLGKSLKDAFDFARADIAEGNSVSQPFSLP